MSAKHNQIANHLITDILDGSYRVGERLPSERDLASRFQANRGAVREAMKTLQQIGLADIQPGGARVKQRNQASLDVIGHILNRGELPDREVVDQIRNRWLATVGPQSLARYSANPRQVNGRPDQKSVAQDCIPPECSPAQRKPPDRSVVDQIQNLRLETVCTQRSHRVCPPRM